MNMNQKVMFAAYVGSGNYLTAEEIAKKAGIATNEAKAELDDLIHAGRMIQLCVNNKYVFAHTASIKA
jgi:hypothetical protein